jgi:hypothetical protein
MADRQDVAWHPPKGGTFPEGSRKEGLRQEQESMADVFRFQNGLFCPAETSVGMYPVICVFFLFKI